MGRSWREVKAEKERLDVGAGRDVEGVRSAARARTHAYIVGFRLSVLRERAGVTQTELAARMGVSQPRISQLEKGELSALEVDTVDRYVAALGGRLKIVADFDDHEVTVSSSEVDGGVCV
jgi:DNA-binding XRE family transcriptional regulator